MKLYQLHKTGRGGLVMRKKMNTGAGALLLGKFHGTTKPVQGSGTLLLSKNHGTDVSDTSAVKEKLEDLSTTLKNIRLRGSHKKKGNNIKL